MGIKTNFSIKDLENLSGVKAHTIRIWEKRYDLLKPERSETNIRTYNLNSLQKLLNVSVLNEHGMKVSKIAKLSDDDISSQVKELSIVDDSSQHFMHSFKLAMLTFDQELFDATYNTMLKTFSFREIFQGIFMQLLQDIGVLWVTNTITPAHEHFISTLIQQKLQINIEKVQGTSDASQGTFVLFLPLNEIHDLGLMYIHYELLLKSYKCIYLGQSVPIENLLEVKKVFDKMTFISYFTVSPPNDSVDQYLKEISSLVLTDKGEELHIFGRNTKEVNISSLPSNIRIHENMEELLQFV